MPLLASDTISTPLNRAAKLVVASATRKIDAYHHLADRIDRLKNIAQAN
jgi:hypothetical protein